MLKPSHFELKRWLCNNSIVGLRIHYVQTGTDTAETEWELTPQEGKSKRLRADTIIPLINLEPDWYRVLKPVEAVLREVRQYQEFANREAKDLAEYERLKAKFESHSGHATKGA